MFPYGTVSAQNRSFQKQWLNEFAWLAYSNIYNGAFCKWCVMFAPQTVSRSTKPPGSLVRDHTVIIKRQRNITIIIKTVTIINYVQPYSITLCRQMPTNPEMYETLWTAVDRRLSLKIEIVFPISSELLNFAVAKKYHWGVTETLAHFHWTKLIAMTEFLKLP